MGVLLDESWQERGRFGKLFFFFGEELSVKTCRWVGDLTRGGDDSLSDTTRRGGREPL